MDLPAQNCNRRNFLKVLGAGAVIAGLPAPLWAKKDNRPNIVWIVAEDMSRHFGYNGETTIKTPNVDRMAEEGVVFENAYITCPVCSPGRSAMVTGMYQTTIGAHQHRSGRGTEKIYLPRHVKPIPQIFREAGYYVSNGSGPQLKGAGKTDYNFVYDKNLYDGPDWSGRKPGQPFFAQVMLKGGKYRSDRNNAPVSPADVKLPPYYPDDPVMRQDWAEYLNSVMTVDKNVGQVIQRLKDEGLADNTVVIFITDHGISHARGKQFCYEEGVHIPFVVWSPGKLKPAVRKDLIAHIDMAATSMYFAGIDIPDYLESRPLFGKDAKPREYVVSARDRCDETVERIRSVRKGNFKYIRNFHHLRPHLQPNAYKDKKPTIVRLRELHVLGKLDKNQLSIVTSYRQPEELYDLEKDPWELNNLALDKSYKNQMKEMQAALAEWIEQSGDKGQYPEPDAMYDSDMKVYLDGMRSKANMTEHVKVIERNIAQMKKWQAEGK
ncbi:MAG: sulfatase-like hydrolase/transferase [Planctomycetes bacterium]|nr:sulfatase-like hydrolase/transferase [Planctomycetota bacterium]